VGTTTVPTRHWHRCADGRIQCDLCPRECKLRPGQRGLCFIRERRDDQIVLTTYGLSSGFGVDPIEKKPLFHFHPGTSALSFGTAGCNLACRYCQNWEISKARRDQILAVPASPGRIAVAAARLECRSVAFTYNDPVPFHEYAIDTAVACRDRGIATVAVTAGYVSPAPRAEFYRHMDAANIDLKSIDDAFYRRYCAGRLAPVLDTLEYVHHGTDVWLEITNLVIPGCNDSPGQIARLAEWIHTRLGPDVPLHLTAFRPAFRMRDHSPTPPESLFAAAAIAGETGLHHVYLGNLAGTDGTDTWCPECGDLLIERRAYRIVTWHLVDGTCPRCGTRCRGRFDSSPGNGNGYPRPVDIARS
jgi:pyruvate formate lyase activating enzyme